MSALGVSHNIPYFVINEKVAILPLPRSRFCKDEMGPISSINRINGKDQKFWSKIGCHGRFSPWSKIFENLVSNLLLSIFVDFWTMSVTFTKKIKPPLWIAGFGGNRYKSKIWAKNLKNRPFWA